MQMSRTRIEFRYVFIAMFVALVFVSLQVIIVEWLFEPKADSSAARLVLYLFSVIVVGCSAAAAFAVGHWIRRRIDFIQDMMRRAMDGDLTPSKRDKSLGAPELDDFENSAKSLIDSIRMTVVAFSDVKDALKSSDSQMAKVTSLLSAASSEQAAAIAQATSNAEETKQTGVSARAGAQRIVQTAEKSVEVSSEGLTAVESSLKAINLTAERVGGISSGVDGLRGQIGEVGAIIALVNEIAGQSNLLAVNASIEAAKAGEYGRGFAVVAQEVKNLADQSKRATNQVRETLGRIQKAIEELTLLARSGQEAATAGVRSMEYTGDVINKLTKVISANVEAAQHIAINTNEQVVGLEQITQAMMSVNMAANDNLKVIQEVEETAKGFSLMSDEIEEWVGRYKIKA